MLDDQIGMRRNHFRRRAAIWLGVLIAAGVGGWFLWGFAQGVVATIRNNERLLLGVQYVEGHFPDPPPRDIGLFTDEEVELLVAEKNRRSLVESKPDRQATIETVARILGIPLEDR